MSYITEPVKSLLEGALRRRVDGVAGGVARGDIAGVETTVDSTKHVQAGTLSILAYEDEQMTTGSSLLARERVGPWGGRRHFGVHGYLAHTKSRPPRTLQ